MLNWTNRTHVEHVKDPDKVLFPSGNLVPVALREDESEHCTPFTLLNDLDMNLCYGSATWVSESFAVPISDPAHVVRFPIASMTGWLSPSNLLPSNLR